MDKQELIELLTTASESFSVVNYRDNLDRVTFRIPSVPELMRVLAAECVATRELHVYVRYDQITNKLVIKCEELQSSLTRTGLTPEKLGELAGIELHCLDLMRIYNNRPYFKEINKGRAPLVIALATEALAGWLAALSNSN